MNVLLVEDDLHLAKAVLRLLKRRGFVVNHLSEGQTACIYIKAESPKIIILDLGLPDIDGLDVLKFIRKHKISSQVLILTARDSSHDTVFGLDNGADDYLVKPFDPSELLARLRVMERRLGTSYSAEIILGPVSLNAEANIAMLHGKKIRLSNIEFMLLKALMGNFSVIHSRKDLESKIYKWGNEVTSNSIDVHIHNLRKKLPEGFIQTVHGIGYTVRKL